VTLVKQQKELEQQIDLCNVQISDLQQKLIDADQGMHAIGGCVTVATSYIAVVCFNRPQLRLNIDEYW